MRDMTFESQLEGLLREYAQAGVRPVDRYAIAEEAIASGRATPRWWRGPRMTGSRVNRVLFPLLVALIVGAVVGGALLIGSRFVPPPRTYLNELVPVPELSMPMAYPTLVPLLDGRVLVIGDDGDGGGRGTRALVYDPATGGSEAIGQVVSDDELAVESAVRLKDGTVLAIWDGAGHIFDPNTMRFAPAGPMATPRGMGVKAVLLGDGRVLIAGGDPAGQDGATRSAELFDPVTATFSPTGSMTTSQAFGSMVILPDGRVFVGPGGGQTTVQIYDPRTGTFSDAGTVSSYGFGDLSTFHEAPRPILLPDGRVFLLGGFSLGDRGFAEEWDPTSQTTSPEHALPGWVLSATRLDDGRILLIGGRPSNWSGVYDPATGVTTRIESTKAWGPKATRLDDGRVLIVGGVADGNLRADSSVAPGVSTVEVFQ